MSDIYRESARENIFGHLIGKECYWRVRDIILSAKLNAVFEDTRCWFLRYGDKDSLCVISKSESFYIQLTRE